MESRISKYRIVNGETFFALLFVSLAIVAFFPLVYNSAGLYQLVKYVIYGVLVYLAVATRIVKVLNSKAIVISMLIVFFAALQLLIFNSQGLRVRWNDISCLVIVVLLMGVGFCCHMDENQIELAVLVFAAFSTVAGLWSMFYYVGDLTITGYLYAVDAKNQIGQFVASSAAGVMVLLFTNKKNRIIKIALLSMLVVLLFVLRCRTALLAFLVFAVYYYFKSHEVHNLFFVLMFFVLFFVLFYDQILSFMEDVFVGNKDITDMNAVSSNRMERNVEGMRFWSLNPIFGEMKTPSDVLRIHNYLINILVAYGIFAFPFFVLFFYLLFLTVKKWKKSYALNVSCVGYWIMFIPFFCSLLEPSAPYGPGLVQAVPFFLLGNSMRMIKENRLQNVNTA